MPDSLDRLRTQLSGRYRIERELGRGGMATVYLAIDEHHDRSVALKVLHSDLAATLGSERFQREIKLAARLQHPHILSVYDSGDAGGVLWFTMPFVEGESLRDRLTRERQLSIPEALRIAREVALALDFAHRHGVVHRDIKPENILLTDGQAMVADFGIARATHRRRRAHADRAVGRDAGVHEPRAGVGRAWARRARRHLRARRRRLRNARRRGAVHRAERAGHHRAQDDGDAATDQRVAQHGASGARRRSSRRRSRGRRPIGPRRRATVATTLEEIAARGDTGVTVAAPPARGEIAAAALAVGRGGRRPRRRSRR